MWISELESKYAYLHLDGVRELSAEETSAYVLSVEENVIPEIERILEAKAEGSRAAMNQIVY